MTTFSPFDRCRILVHLIAHTFSHRGQTSYLIFQRTLKLKQRQCRDVSILEFHEISDMRPDLLCENVCGIKWTKILHIAKGEMSSLEEE